MTPPLGDIAHLGHVELLTPDLRRQPSVLHRATSA